MATRILRLMGWLGIAVASIALVAQHGLLPGERYAYYVFGAGMACVIACVLGQWRGIARIFDRPLTRYGAAAVTGVLIVLCVVGATRQSRLSDQTLAVLARLDSPLTVVVFERPFELQRWQDELKEYEYASRRVSAEYVDPDTQPAVAKQYQVQQYGTAVCTYKGRTEPVDSFTEQALTNGIARVVFDQQRKLYFTSGHGERDTASSEPGGYGTMSAALGRDRFTVGTVEISRQGGVPGDAAVLVVAGPRTDFVPGDIDALTRYLGNNGKLLMALDPPVKPDAPPLTNLIALAHDWGFDVGNDIIIDASGLGQILGVDASVPVASNYPLHPITPGFTLLTAFPLARSVSPVTGGVNGRSPQTFVETGPNSWAETDATALVAGGEVTVAFDEAKGDRKGPVSIAAAVSAPSVRSDGGDPTGTPAAGARVAIVGDSDFASNAAVTTQGNKDLFLNTIGWLSA
ncbi:MAG: GldG family protein, partial [Acidobacteria bacterium]|nr:GldG family protein [Acidobacteriota bacterium]